MKKIIFIITFTLLPATLIEMNLADFLFKKVKYTNVNDFDAKIQAFKNSKWNAVFIGSSETHWGVSPKVFDDILNNQFLNK